MVLIAASCTVLWTSVHSSSHTLSDLIPWIYLSLSLHNHKGFDWMIYGRPIRSCRINTHTHTHKDDLFIIGDCNAKVESQEIPGVTGTFDLGVQNEAGQRLTEYCQENTLVITSIHFQQHKRWLCIDITRWSILKSDCFYSLQLKKEELYTVSKKRRSGANCGSNHELLIAYFILKFKKVGKTTSPFRYEVNQFP